MSPGDIVILINGGGDFFTYNSLEEAEENPSADNEHTRIYIARQVVMESKPAIWKVVA